MKVALCCIGKNENRYIREYIDHYRTVGVDKIFLFDTNDPDGERFEEIIQPEIDSGFVEITDYRGEKVCQLRAYQECYDKHGGEYNWIMFIDCGDEYWRSDVYKDIKEFLSQKRFEPFDMIHVNLQTFGDCGQLRYEDKPLKERFLNPLPHNVAIAFIDKGIPENFHVSSIIRGGRIVYWMSTPHTPHPSKHLSCCNTIGIAVNPQSPLAAYERYANIFAFARFDHYTFKSVEEYALKIKRGFPDQATSYEKLKCLVEDRFFRANERTDEKEKLFNEILYPNDEQV